MRIRSSSPNTSPSALKSPAPSLSPNAPLPAIKRAVRVIQLDIKIAVARQSWSRANRANLLEENSHIERARRRGFDTIPILIARQIERVVEGAGQSNGIDRRINDSATRWRPDECLESIVIQFIAVKFERDQTSAVAGPCIQGGPGFIDDLQSFDAGEHMLERFRIAWTDGDVPSVDCSILRYTTRSSVASSTTISRSPTAAARTAIDGNLERKAGIIKQAVDNGGANVIRTVSGFDANFLDRAADERVVLRIAVHDVQQVRVGRLIHIDRVGPRRTLNENRVESDAAIDRVRTCAADERIFARIAKQLIAAI